MAERKKPRKRLEELIRARPTEAQKKDARIKETQALLSEIGVLRADNADSTSRNAALQSENAILGRSNVALMEQLRSVEEELELYRANAQSHSTDVHGSSNSDSLVATDLSTAPLGSEADRTQEKEDTGGGKIADTAEASQSNPPANEPIAPTPASQTNLVAHSDAAPDTAFQISSDGNVRTPTSLADDSGPHLPVHDNAQLDTLSIAGPSSDGNAGTGEDSKPAWLTNPNEYDEVKAEDSTNDWLMVAPTTNAVEGSASVADPTLVQELLSCGLDEEDAETYFKRFNNDMSRAADRYWKDVEDGEKFFENEGVPIEWRRRFYIEAGNELAAQDLWDRIRDVIQILRVMDGRSEDETWRTLVEEDFDPNRVGQRLAREAGYSEDARQEGGGENTDLKGAAESGDDQDSGEESGGDEGPNEGSGDDSDHHEESGMMVTNKNFAARRCWKWTEPDAELGG